MAGETVSRSRLGPAGRRSLTALSSRRLRLFGAGAPRRVLQIITPSHMSGAEMQLVRMTRRMEARGHVMPTLVKTGSPAIAHMERLGLAVEQAGISGKLNLLAVPRIAAAAKRHQVDLIQSTLSTASQWCGWLETLGGPKSIGHVQGFTSARWHSRQCHLLANSMAVREDLIAQGIPADRITVLYNSTDDEDFAPRRDPRAIRQEFGADDETPIVGTFGHLSVKKGYRELFEAIPKVLARTPNAQFWIVGRGDLQSALEAQAFSQGFHKNVRFAGFRTDAADVMNAIDVMALPSHREPFGIVYVEAALLKKPVIACSAGGAAETVAANETGLLVPPYDPDKLAEAILTLLENRDRARQLGERGRERVRELFNWDTFIATLEDVYDRVLSQS